MTTRSANPTTAGTIPQLDGANQESSEEEESEDSEEDDVVNQVSTYCNSTTLMQHYICMHVCVGLHACVGILSHYVWLSTHVYQVRIVHACVKQGTRV